MYKRQEPVSTEGSELHVDLSNYGYSSTSEPENISLLNHIRIDLKGDSQSWFESYQGGNVIGYCAENRPTEYYLAFGDFGKYATLYDVILEWYHSAQSGTKPSDASSTTTTNAVSRDSLIKAADSYVDLGGYLWYTAGGKFCRWHEGGSVETVCDLPLDYDTPVSASLSTQDNRILMNYHIGGAIMGSFITDLYDTDGKKLSSINGYNAIAISGDIIVMTDHFMPTPNNMSISYDCGKTFTEFGDKDWFYGSALTEDGTYVTSVNSSLEIRDGYVSVSYTHREHFVQQGDDDTSAGSADGVADGDRAAVDVDLAHVEAELTGNSDGLGREGFVGLDEVDIVDGQAGLLHRCV